MLKKLTMAAVLAMPLVWAAPAAAQQSGVLLIYGKDKCPTNDDGEEIVVCQRLDESERFRIPKDLRDADVRPQQESWAVRQQEALATGTGSCSAVGANGASGCFVKQATAARAETRKRKKEAEDLPLP